ncbi:MIC25 protein, partial [Pedionomus torquatus]|nr:MIC25 protein [Pedionomus torquatus]
FQLTEDVVNRMKESSQSKRDNQRFPRSSNGTAPSSPAAEGKPRSPTGTVSPSQVCCFDTLCSGLANGCYMYEQEQALVQEELLRLAKREREAASEALNTALQRERSNANEERQRAAQLVSSKTLQYVSIQDRVKSLYLRGFFKCHLCGKLRN